jgi:hypothetical protein
MYRVPYNHRNNLYITQSHAFRSGNMKLVHEFNTSSFELYDLESDISESNNLIDGNETLYADMIRDMYTKMKALGPCPNDKVGSFILSGGENGGQLTTCSWFTKNKGRCEHHVEGRLFCPSACASRISKKMCNREKYPPILPGSPPYDCADSPLPFLMRMRKEGGPKKVMFKKCSKLKRCRTSSVASHCPLTCNKCSEYQYQDSEKKFRTSNPNRIISCKSMKLERCEDPEVRKICRATCGNVATS